MAPPNLFAAANSREAEPVQDQENSLPSGETLDDFEPLSLIEIDPKGHLCIEHEGLRSLIERIFTVIKDQYEKQNQVGEDIYDVRSNLTAVERQCVHLNVQMKECQESIQKTMLQINTMGVSSAQMQSNAAADEKTGI